MKNKLFFYGVMFLQVFNVFSSDSEITTEPSVGMFQVKSSQDYQSLKKPKNMKIFVGEEAFCATQANHQDEQKVLKFIEENKIVIPKGVRSVVGLLSKNSIVMAYHFPLGNVLFERYKYQLKN